jgi:3-phosphoshikimate 1-carboxyvinyltransferase
MRALLEGVGIQVQRGPDWIEVHGGEPKAGDAIVETVRDHRVAMSAAVVGARAAGLRIADPGCVEKSWPGFWGAWAALLSSA